MKMSRLDFLKALQTASKATYPDIATSHYDEAVAEALEKVGLRPIRAIREAIRVSHTMNISLDSLHYLVVLEEAYESIQ